MGVLKDQWHEFKRAKPGQRFQDRYQRNKDQRSGRTSLLRFLKPVGGVLLLVAGIVFCLIPGPDAPLLLIGAALLADVSLPVARAMDWTEVRARAVFARFHELWKSASAPAKVAGIALATFLLAAICYGTFQWWTAHH